MTETVCSKRQLFHLGLGAARVLNARQARQVLLWPTNILLMKW
jgi:hypothetical protein